MLRGLRNRLFGDDGERLAAKHLRRLGFRVVAQQWTCRYGELDLVVRKGSLVVFVEVKTRSSSHGDRPEQAVDARKQRQITRAAQAWIKRHGRDGWSYRFDVIGLVLAEGQLPELKHIEHAFEAVD